MDHGIRDHGIRPQARRRKVGDPLFCVHELACDRTDESGRHAAGHERQGACYRTDPDGYLWLGTPAGLFRFDGISFTAWQPEAGQNLFSDFVCALLCRQGHLSQLFKQSRQITETFSSAFC